MNNEPFITTHGLAKILRVSPRTIRRWVQCRRIPQPVKLSPNQAFWTQDTVEEMLRNLRNNGK